MAEKSEIKSEMPSRTVFLVHSSADAARAEVIKRGLRSHGFSVDDGSFEIGKPLLENIVGAIARCDTVLVFLTKASLASRWVSFETLLAIEMSCRTRRLAVRLVTDEISADELKTLKTGELANLPHSGIDFNRETWMKDLSAQITADIVPTTVLPAGNIAHGLVFSYFIGFLRNILTELKRSVEESDWTKKYPGQISCKFHILLPLSCRAGSFECEAGEGHPAIKSEGSLTVVLDYGGKKRHFNLPLYSIQKHEEKYLFLGEIPNVLETMSKMVAMDLMAVDTRLQVERFRVTLEDVLNHRNNEVFNDTVVMHSYDDELTKPGDMIWEAVSAELKQIRDQMESRIVMRRETLRVKVDDSAPELPVTASRGYTCMVTYGDTPSDTSTASDIIAFLLSKKLENVGTTPERDPTDFKDFECIVFVLSLASLSDPEVTRQYEAALRVCQDSETTRIVPVFVGSDTDQLPQKVKWMTVLRRDDGKYLDKIWKTMTEPVARVRESLPSGDVATGLAWAYLINYLIHPVFGKTEDGKDFRQRCEDGLTKYKAGCSCICRLFIVIPKSCVFPGPPTAYDREELLGTLEPVVVGSRKYFLTFFKYTTKTGKSVCYAREYATPVITLHEMAHKYAFAGLSLDSMQQQSQALAEHITQVAGSEPFITKVGDMRSRICLIHFDDAKETVSEAIERNVLECLETDELVVAPM